MPDACQRYHDHVASIYDDIYNSPYWKFYHDLSWSYMKPHLPRDLSLETHDAGCGTGRFGLKLLKAGFRVLFSDTSPQMLDAAQRKVDAAGYADRAEFARIDVADMASLAEGRFGFFCAQGDPVSLCADPFRAFSEAARTLVPGGTAVLSVDNRAAGYEHFIEKGDIKGLSRFHKDGILTWLAEKSTERFPFHTFEPEQIEEMSRRAGFDVVSIVGKCVLPVRKFADLLEDRALSKQLLKVEKKLSARPTYLGRASHLQVTLRKPV